MSAWVYDTEDSGLRELFELARDKSTTGRGALMRALTELFATHEPELSERERALMSEILRQLVHSVEMDVRRRLADALADKPQAPKDLVVALANDAIEVAYPILLGSVVLRDQELVEVIRHRTMQHRLAIARRKAVSERVADALVGSGEESVIVALLENRDAQISQATMEYLVEQSRRVDSYQNPLLARPDLGRDLAKRMYWWVSAALRQHIIQDFAVDPSELDEQVDTATSTAIAEDAAVHGAAGSAARRLAASLGDGPGQDVEFLVRVLREGEVSLFESMFARFCGVRQRLVARLLYERGGEGLAIACRALNVSGQDFLEIYRLTRAARRDGNAEVKDNLARMTQLYERMEPESAVRVLRGWQRSTGYLTAIHDLKTRAVG